jgi:hypothetical protein
MFLFQVDIRNSPFLTFVHFCLIKTNVCSIYALNILNNTDGIAAITALHCAVLVLIFAVTNLFVSTFFTMVISPPAFCLSIHENYIRKYS